MGQQSKAKRNPNREPRSKPRVINQGDSDKYTYANVALTGEEIDECVEIRLGGHIHFIHADTALVLRNRLTKALEEWDKSARGLGHYGLCHRDESESEFLQKQKRFNESLMLVMTGQFVEFNSDESIPDDAKL